MAHERTGRAAVAPIFSTNYERNFRPMKNQIIKLEGVPLETLAEFANDAGEQAEKHAIGAVQFALQAGRALQAAKDQVQHGEWLAWLGANWNYHQVTASRYMRLANQTCVFNLKSAASINEALRIVAEDPETPKQTRSNKAGVTVIEPDQVKKTPDVEVVPVAASDPVDTENQDTGRMLEETTAAYGTAEGIDVVVEPSVSPGYAYLSILIGTECVWLKRPIIRKGIPVLLRGEIPADARLSWEFTENADRVNQALFAIT